MRCILEHGKMIIIAESEFEAGYLGELLVNKMQGTATRDATGNISKLSFHKKAEELIVDELEEIPDVIFKTKELIDEERDLEELPDFIDEETAELVEEIEEVDNFNATVIDDGTIELDEEMTIIPGEITDLGDIEIDNDLDIDLDSMEINFDELDDEISLDLD